MQFAKPLQRWEFKGREKRFFIYGKGEGQTAHCPNTGSMMGLLDATHVWVTDHGAGGTRKLRYTAEILELPHGASAVVNTAHANTLAGEALQAGLVPGTAGLTDLRHEVKYSPETRFDWAFTNAQGQRVWVEVKNVTLAEGATAQFPDAVTTRGAKHLDTLAAIVRQGGAALQLYVVARTDATQFAPAKQIDPAYTKALQQAMKAGVQVVALGCTITPARLEVCKTLPIML